MAEWRVVEVGVRELKNRLSAYLRLAKQDREIVVTERGKPIAVIQTIRNTSSRSSLEARIAALAARGEITAPKRRLVPRRRRIKLPGPLLSDVVIADRR